MFTWVSLYHLMAGCQEFLVLPGAKSLSLFVLLLGMCSLGSWGPTNDSIKQPSGLRTLLHGYMPLLMPTSHTLSKSQQAIRLARQAIWTLKWWEVGSPYSYAINKMSLSCLSTICVPPVIIFICLSGDMLSSIITSKSFPSHHQFFCFPPYTIFI